MEAVLNTLKEDFAIININIKLSLKSIVDEDACLDVDVVVLRVPVGLEGHWNTIPTIGVHMAEAISNTLNDALSKDSWLYMI